MNNLFRPTALVLTLAACLGASACTPSVDVRGNLPHPDMLSQIKAGKTTRDEVQALLGTPSTASTYGNENWQYISSRTETVAFFKPELKDRKVISITFDDNGTVKGVTTLGMENGVALAPVDRETPTAGKEMSLIGQLLGNVGRFSKEAAPR